MNEISTSLYEGMGLVLLILILYSLLNKSLLTSLLSVIISFVMAQTAINGNIVDYYVVNNILTPKITQSLPIHYLLLGIAAIMTILTFYILVMVLIGHIERIGDSGEQRRLED
jgi:hypothetical protein